MEGMRKERKGVCCLQESPCFCAGNLVFHGPREDVVPYFQSLGFYVPERKAVSDFLQEVTSKKDQKVGNHSYIIMKGQTNVKCVSADSHHGGVLRWQSGVFTAYASALSRSS